MQNPFSLEGKTILITGASSGIGKAVAQECAAAGATCIISARNEERLSATFGSLEGDGHQSVPNKGIVLCDFLVLHGNLRRHAGAVHAFHRYQDLPDHDDLQHSSDCRSGRHRLHHRLDHRRVSDQRRPGVAALFG